MRNQSYRSFGRRIDRSARDKGLPLRVMFELTYRCNFKCAHCYLPPSYKERKGELNTRQVIAVIARLKELGCLYLGFTGGEPFMRKDIMDILWYAKRNGFQVIVYTNGSLIDERVAGELAVLGPNKVDITIPAMTAQPFERVIGVPGWRDKVFKAIEFLHENGVNLGFKSCLLKENEAEIKKIEEFAQSLGACHRLDEMLSPRLDGAKGPYRYRGKPISQPETLIASASCPPQTSNLESRTSNLFPCGAGRTQAAITPFGELKICLMIDYPKYKAVSDTAAADSVKEAWGKLKELAGNITPDEDYQCAVCALKPYCKWCPARSWLYNRTFTRCEPQSRLFAQRNRDRVSAISGSRRL